MMKNSELKRRTDYSLEFGKVNRYSTILVFLFFTLTMLVYQSIWTNKESPIDFSMIKNSFLYVFVFAIILHELLHAFTYALFTKTGIKAIRFGFKWKYLTPYCHCTEKLKVKHYKLAAAMPLFVMGIIPSVYSIIAGNSIVFFYGITCMCMSAGDSMVLIKLRKLNNEQFIIDHPSRVGFITE